MVMAGKLLKKKAHKVMPKKTPVEQAKKTVLVGTYKGDQLEKWPGYYNYPISSKDKIDVESAKKVNELWLFQGAKAGRYFSAEYVGTFSRDELKTQFGYPAKGKPHGDKYLLYKITKTDIYDPATGLVEAVIVRAKDFKTASRTGRQIKAYLESSERKDPVTANLVPKILTELPREVLRVCEVAVQMDFFAKIVLPPGQSASLMTMTTAGVLPAYRYEQRDALSFMNDMPDETVQLVLTSPPYNVGKEYEAKTSIQQYLLGMVPIIKQIARVLKVGGSVCWQVGNYVNDGEVFPLDIFYYTLFKDVGLRLRNRIIWHFGHGLHCKNRFSGRYETILWFTKGDDYVFNLDDVRIPSKYPGKRYYKGDKKGQLSGNPLGKNPEDVWVLGKVAEDWRGQIWDIPNVKSNHPEKVDHPCQFPIELVERCVLALSNKGDIVYDPFAGVGSTIIGAAKNGRIGFGTELEKKYVDIGLSRINDLAHGRLKMRPVTQEIFNADKAGSLSRTPVEWLKKGESYENR